MSMIRPLYPFKRIPEPIFATIEVYIAIIEDHEQMYLSCGKPKGDNGVNIYETRRRALILELEGIVRDLNPERSSMLTQLQNARESQRNEDLRLLNKLTEFINGEITEADEVVKGFLEPVSSAGLDTSGAIAKVSIIRVIDELTLKLNSSYFNPYSSNAAATSLNNPTIS